MVDLYQCGLWSLGFCWLLQKGTQKAGKHSSCRSCKEEEESRTLRLPILLSKYSKRRKQHQAPLQNSEMSTRTWAGSTAALAKRYLKTLFPFIFKARAHAVESSTPSRGPTIPQMKLALQDIKTPKDIFRPKFRVSFTFCIKYMIFAWP